MAGVKYWIEGVPVEPEAIAQIEKVASLPFIHKHVAVMPDVHVGKGSTVGTVFASENVVIPAAVGVDIGCGMVAGMTNLTASDLPDSLHSLRLEIESVVPHGRTDNGGANDRGSWGNLPRKIEREWGNLLYEYLNICEFEPRIESRRNPATQLGTLGGGNHFIEICLDESDRVWIMLHSGSRGIGNKIGQIFIEKAKLDMQNYYINLPDSDLAYLPTGTKNFKEYIKAVSFAQTYARVNRQIMFDAVKEAIEEDLAVEVEIKGSIANCHHNYISQEKHFGKDLYVTRKGAISAKFGEIGIIPGSMGNNSYIVEGLGNEQSFTSCSHGAGRIMSRTKAKAAFDIDSLNIALQGVESRRDSDILDEHPLAYKNIEEVMYAQKDLVRPVHQLKQILCVKG